MQLLIFGLFIQTLEANLQARNNVWVFRNRKELSYAQNFCLLLRYNFLLALFVNIYQYKPASAKINVIQTMFFKKAIEIGIPPVELGQDFYLVANNRVPTESSLILFALH